MIGSLHRSFQQVGLASDFVLASSIDRKKRIIPSEIQLVPGHCSYLGVFSEKIPHGLQYPQLFLEAPLTASSSTLDSSLLSLDHPKYGLPKALVANFASLGICTIYPWQASCLLGRGHLTGEKSLIYSAPTGGGKSLVADILMLKRIIKNPTQKAILVLPYVALVQEKLKWLRQIVQHVEKDTANDESLDGMARLRSRLSSKDIRVAGFYGGSRPGYTWADTDIAVCTIEKVRSIARHFLKR